MAQFWLRVNGIEIEGLKVRRKMVSGAPIGERELVIEDPLLGRFAIDEAFILEARTDRRKKWKSITISDLFEMIDSIPSFQL